MKVIPESCKQALTQCLLLLGCFLQLYWNLPLQWSLAEFPPQTKNPWYSPVNLFDTLSIRLLHLPVICMHVQLTVIECCCYLQMSKAFLMSPAMADTFLAQNCTADASRMLLPASTLKQKKNILVLAYNQRTKTRISLLVKQFVLSSSCQTEGSYMNGPLSFDRIIEQKPGTMPLDPKTIIIATTTLEDQYNFKLTRAAIPH